MLLVGRQEGYLAWKKTEWWGAGAVVCLERGADLHMAQLMPLPLTVSCFSKIQTGFTFLVQDRPGSPGKGAVNRTCVVDQHDINVNVNDVNVNINSTVSFCNCNAANHLSHTLNPSPSTEYCICSIYTE